MTSASPDAADGGRTDPRYRQQLCDILARDEASSSDRIQEMLQLGADRYGVELGLLVRIDRAGDTYTIDEVSAPHPNITRGLTGDLLSTYCRMVVTEREPLAIENAPKQGWAEDPAYQSSLLSTYIGTAVTTGDTVYGTVCFVDLDPRETAFDDADRSFLDRLAEAVGQVLEDEASAGSEQIGDPDHELSVVERRYRTALKHSPLLFAKVDTDLRYEWISNPHEDFAPTSVIGKRDDELDDGPGIDQLMDLKRRTLEHGEQLREEIVFERSDGPNVYDVTATPLREGEGDAVTGLITASLNVTDRKEKERQLEESEARYRALAANFPDGAVGMYDKDLRYTLVRGAQVGDVLPSVEEFEGNRVADLFPEETTNDVAPLFRAAVEDGESGSVVTQFGGREWTVWATPLRSEDGTIFAGLSFTQDVTEQHRRERELRLFRQVVEQANDAILITEAAPLDEPGPRIEYANPAFEEMTGYDTNELLGRTPRILQGPDTDRAVLDSLRDALKNGEQWRGQTVNYGKDQTPYELRWSVAPVRNEDGDIEHWMSVQRDVTEKKERENEIRRHRNLLDQTQRLAGAWEIDLRTEAVTWSDTVYEIHEVPAGTKISLADALDFYSPEARAKLEAALHRCIEEQAIHDLDLRLITTEGNERWVRTVGAPVEQEDGEVVKIAGAFQDITDRKEAQKALRRNQERLSMAIEGGNIGTWDWDLETGEVIFNRQWAEMLGYSREELDFHFSTWEKLVHPEDLSRAMDVLDEYIEGERDTYDPEIRMRTKSGNWKWIQTIGKVIDRNESGEVTRTAGIHLDIDERKEAEHGLRASERRFRKVFKNAAIGIVIGDEDGRLLQANSAFQSMVGYEEAELQDLDFSDLTHPDDVAADCALFDELISGERSRYQVEKRYVRKDGETFWGRTTASELELGEEKRHVRLVENIDDQKHYEAKLREAKQEAEEAAHLKSVMLANM
ncbi:MAG TPA: PAS domain S-box protein, partial [Salinibacter sp.]|nr:PAS domain S-box protein [Salinibacter sp.]